MSIPRHKDFFLSTYGTHRNSIVIVFYINICMFGRSRSDRGGKVCLTCCGGVYDVWWSEGGEASFFIYLSDQ